MNTLIVDGDNLLTIGFYGCKDYHYKDQHIGGIYHFLNTLRKMIDGHSLDKIVVFWDGQNGPQTRRTIYPSYKKDSKSRLRSEEELTSYQFQRNRIKQYLEELYVRQGEYEFCESDDSISYYSKISLKENKIIYSSDGDLTQLIKSDTKLYHPIHHILYDNNDMYLFHKEYILIENVKIVKMVCGDPSDNILGIKGLGLKTLIKLFPEIKTKPITLSSFFEKSNLLLEENQKNKTLLNIVNGVTKESNLGFDFFKINQDIIDLTNPLLTDHAKEDILELYENNLDTEGRSYKNTIKLMMEDGIFQVLPKNDDGWLNFLNPFLKLTRKEKNKRLITIKPNE